MEDSGMAPQATHWSEGTVTGTGGQLVAIGRWRRRQKCAATEIRRLKRRQQGEEPADGAAAGGGGGGGRSGSLAELSGLLPW